VSKATQKLKEAIEKANLYKQKVESLDIFSSFLEKTGLVSRNDIKGRHQLFTNPDTPHTSTYLEEGAVELIADMMFIGETFPEFQCLSTASRIRCETSLSHLGWSTQKVVDTYSLENRDKAGGLMSVINQISGGGSSESD
jgi:hypothetical protein